MARASPRSHPPNPTTPTRPSERPEKLTAIPGVSGTRIWDMPFRTMRDQLRIPIADRRKLAMEFEPFAWRPTLWKARVLHFQGHQRGDTDSQDKSLDESIDDHRDAVQLYTNKLV